jgi:hypothetical protein
MQKPPRASEPSIMENAHVDEQCHECGQRLTHWVVVESRNDIRFTVCGWRCLIGAALKRYFEVVDVKVAGAKDALQTIQTLLGTITSPDIGPTLKRIRDTVFFLERGRKDRTA